MLSAYVDLKPGDWVIQNPSNSGVGRAVIAFGKARGLRLINLVRRQDDIAEVEAAGGEVVLVDDERALDQITKAVGDGRVPPCFGRRGWRGNRAAKRVPYHSTVNSSDILLWAAMLRRAIFGPS
jgi:hypothetical protein